jgi:hypothetical protein
MAEINEALWHAQDDRIFIGGRRKGIVVEAS